MQVVERSRCAKVWPVIEKVKGGWNMKQLCCSSCDLSLRILEVMRSSGNLQHLRKLVAKLLDLWCGRIEYWKLIFPSQEVDYDNTKGCRNFCELGACRFIVKTRKMVPLKVQMPNPRPAIKSSLSEARWLEWACATVETKWIESEEDTAHIVRNSMKEPTLRFQPDLFK